MADSEKGKVLTLPGVHAADHALGAQPEPNVIQLLRELLDEAATGDIQGVAVAMVRANRHTSIAMACGPRVSHEVAAAVGDLMYSTHKRRDEQSTTDQQGDPL